MKTCDEWASILYDRLCGEEALEKPTAEIE